MQGRAAPFFVSVASAKSAIQINMDCGFRRDEATAASE
jgi:hypothetical protein